LKDYLSVLTKVWFIDLSDTILLESRKQRKEIEYFNQYKNEREESYYVETQLKVYGIKKSTSFNYIAHE
jgi:hypothetical protein